MGKIFGIGDIHGCYHKLVLLMERITPDFANDLVVFVGDYIDRGEQSYEVVEYLMDLKSRYRDQVVLLKGNHEEMLENYLNGPDKINYLVNGGSKTISNYVSHGYPQYSPIPPSHLEFMESLSLYHETESYIFVHAGLIEGIPLQEQQADQMLWVRERFIRSSYDFGKLVIFGHTPFPEPLVMENKIGIDTGAVYGNKLTCIELPEKIFHQV